MSSLRILLVDDSGAYCASLAALLTQDPSLLLVGQAETGAEALLLVARLQPSLVIVDVVLPDLTGFEVTRQLKARSSPPSVIVLTMHTFPRYRAAALSAGADMFLTKDEVPEQLLPAIRRLFTPR